MFSWGGRKTLSDDELADFMPLAFSQYHQAKALLVTAHLLGTDLNNAVSTDLKETLSNTIYPFAHLCDYDDNKNKTLQQLVEFTDHIDMEWQSKETEPAAMRIATAEALLARIGPEIEDPQTNDTNTKALIEALKNTLNGESDLTEEQIEGTLKTLQEYHTTEKEIEKITTEMENLKQSKFSLQDKLQQQNRLADMTMEENQELRDELDAHTQFHKKSKEVLEKDFREKLKNLEDQQETLKRRLSERDAELGRINEEVRAHRDGKTSCNENYQELMAEVLTSLNGILEKCDVNDYDEEEDVSLEDYTKSISQCITTGKDKLEAMKVSIHALTEALGCDRNDLQKCLSLALESKSQSTSVFSRITDLLAKVNQKDDENQKSRIAWEKKTDALKKIHKDEKKEIKNNHLTEMKTMKGAIEKEKNARSKAEIENKNTKLRLNELKKKLGDTNEFEKHIMDSQFTTEYNQTLEGILQELKYQLLHEFKLKYALLACIISACSNIFWWMDEDTHDVSLTVAAMYSLSKALTEIHGIVTDAQITVNMNQIIENSTLIEDAEGKRTAKIERDQRMKNLMMTSKGYAF